MQRDFLIQLTIILRGIAGTSRKPLGIPGRQQWGPHEGASSTRAFAASKLSKAIRRKKPSKKKGESVGKSFPIDQTHEDETFRFEMAPALWNTRVIGDRARVRVHLALAGEYPTPPSITHLGPPIITEDRSQRGGAAMLGTFVDEIRNCMPAWCINSRCLKIPLVPARYGANAGIVGGALCAARGGAPVQATGRTWHGGLQGSLRNQASQRGIGKVVADDFPEAGAGFGHCFCTALA